LYVSVGVAIEIVPGNATSGLAAGWLELAAGVAELVATEVLAVLVFAFELAGSVF
jgi:hypothetical protein